MRPAISDSLISGQPLYLLYSYSNRGSSAGAVALRADLATQATGRVRLQVTGRPPTINALLLLAQDRAPSGRAAAARPLSTCRRSTRCTLLPAAGPISVSISP